MTYFHRSNFGRFSTRIALEDVARSGKPAGAKAKPAASGAAAHLVPAEEDEAAILPK